MKSVRAGLFILAVLSLSGCGDATRPIQGTPATPSARATQNANSPQACDLFTQDMAETILETDIPASESKTTEPNQFGSVVTNCSYATKATNFKDIKTASLLIRYAKDIDESKQIFSGSKDQTKSLSNVEPEMVNGYGDEAYWVGGTLNQLNVRRGTGWFILSYYVGSGDRKATVFKMADLIFKK